MEKHYKKLGAGLFLLIPIIFVAFYKSYFIFIPNFPKDISLMIHLHAFIAIIWVAMLLLQPILINKRKLSLHSKIGKLSYVIFPIFAITSALLIVNLLQSEFARFAAIPIGELTIMVVCYSFAIFYKKYPKLHMRYMIGTAFVLLGPTLGRILPSFIPSWSALARENLKTVIIELFILFLLTLDWKLKADSRPYQIMLLGWGIHHICFNLILAS